MRRLRIAAGILCSLPWVGGGELAPRWLRSLIDVTFVPLCHHWAGRVLVLGSNPMCVCSRCAGLYAGLAVGFLATLPTLPSRTYSRLFGAALALALLDVFTQDLGLHAPFHPARLVTGALLGCSAAAWMVGATARSPQSLASTRRG